MSMMTGCDWCGVAADDECADDCPTRYTAEPLPTLRPRCWWCESRLPHVWHDNGEANDGGLVSPRGGER